MTKQTFTNKEKSTMIYYCSMITLLALCIGSIISFKPEAKQSEIKTDVMEIKADVKELLTRIEVVVTETALNVADTNGEIKVLNQQLKDKK